jgi:hypothetical protein
VPVARFIIFRKRATASGAFRPNPAQVTAHFVYIKSNQWRIS